MLENSTFCRVFGPSTTVPLIAGPSVTLAKTGAGTLALSNANNWLPGGVNVLGGVLQIGTAQALAGFMH